jgi:hypothetical protein
MIATNGRRCQATMRRHIAPPLRDHTHAGQPLLLKVKLPRWVILFPGASFYITRRMLIRNHARLLSFGAPPPSPDLIRPSANFLREEKGNSDNLRIKRSTTAENNVV